MAQHPVDRRPKVSYPATGSEIDSPPARSAQTWAARDVEHNYCFSEEE